MWLSLRDDTSVAFAPVTADETQEKSKQSVLVPARSASTHSSTQRIVRSPFRQLGCGCGLFLLCLVRQGTIVRSAESLRARFSPGRYHEADSVSGSVSQSPCVPSDNGVGRFDGEESCTPRTILEPSVQSVA
jgi:hypothetical protein